MHIYAPERSCHFNPSSLYCKLVYFTYICTGLRTYSKGWNNPFTTYSYYISIREKNPSRTSNCSTPYNINITRWEVQFPLLAHWFPISRMPGLRVFWAKQMEQGMVQDHVAACPWRLMVGRWSLLFLMVPGTPSLNWTQNAPENRSGTKRSRSYSKYPFFRGFCC